MTDRPDRHEDELVSADLDGHATAEESARVRSEAPLAARRAELAAAARAIGAPVEPPGASARDANLATALAAFDTEAGAPRPGGTATPSVTPLPRRPGRLVAAAAAAALVVALAAGVALVARTGGSSTTVAKSTASSASEPFAAGAVAGTGAPTGAAAGAAGTSSTPSLQALGTYPDGDALAGAVRAVLASRGPDTATSAEPQAQTTAGTAADAAAATPATEGGTCRAPADLPYPLLVATAVLADRPVTVFVGTDATDRTYLVALDAACSEVARVAL